MGEDTEPLTTTAANDAAPPISHSGILSKMAGVVVLGSLAGFAFFSPRTGLGVLVGGVLGFANYLWQRHSLKAIFDRAVDGKKTRFLAARYIMRYVLIGGVLTAVYFTETVSIFAVIFGLASFAIAVLIEGFTRIFSGPNS